MGNDRLCVSKKRIFARSKGFTILEILVVLAVLAILIAIAVPRIKGMQDQAGITRAKSELKTLQSAMESFKMNRGSYPDHSGWLRNATPKLVSGSNWTDPWKHHYHLLYPGGDRQYYVIYSQGPGIPNDTNIERCSIGLDTPTGTPYEPAGCQCIFITNAPVASMTPTKT